MDLLDLLRQIEGLSASDAAKVLSRAGILPISGGANDDDNADDDADDDDDAGDDDDADDDAGDDDDKGGDGDRKDKKAGSSKSKASDKTFTQADLDRILRQRMRRERTKIEDAVREKIKSEGKDGDATKELETLRTQVKRLEDLEDAALERYEEELATLPEHIADLAPDDDADIVEKERWMLNKGRPAAKKYREQQDKAQKRGKGAADDGDDKGDRSRARRGMNPQDPDPRKRKDDERESDVQKMAKEARNQGVYRRM